MGMKSPIQSSIEPARHARRINVAVVVDIRLLCRMSFYFRMPDTIDSDIMKPVYVVILQIEIYQILYRSPLYGRNGQDARCQNSYFHAYQSKISLPFSKWK